MFFHNIFFTQKNDQAWFCQQNLWIWQAQYISSEKSLLYLTESVLQFDIFPRACDFFWTVSDLIFILTSSNLCIVFDLLFYYFFFILKYFRTFLHSTPTQQECQKKERNVTKTASFLHLLRSICGSESSASKKRFNFSLKIHLIFKACECQNQNVF